jgi:serine/threonine protein phosphatase 1
VKIAKIEAPIVAAVTDVHGMAHLLRPLLAEISSIEGVHTVFLGDMIDRGPDSSGCMDLIRAHPNSTYIMGNHEEMFLEWVKRACPDEEEDGSYFLSNGGLQTVGSYYDNNRRDFDRARKKMLDDVSWIRESWVDAAETDTHIFVHGGLMPGSPLELQDPDTTRWIRDRFLRCTDDYGKVVVHGHTPTTMAPDVRQNRINLDCGSWMSKRLVAAVIDGDQTYFVEAAEEEGEVVARRKYKTLKTP